MWCVEQTEIENFEYELVLLMRGAFGYGLPGEVSGRLIPSVDFRTCLANR